MFKNEMLAPLKLVVLKQKKSINGDYAMLTTKLASGISEKIYVNGPSVSTFNKGDLIEVQGDYVQEKYGPKIYTQNGFIKKVFREDKEYILKILQNINGIGEVKSNKIYEAFKDNFERHLNLGIEHISREACISLTDAKAVYESIGKDERKYEFSKMLVEARASPNEANKLFNKFEDRHIEIAKNDPYLLGLFGLSFESCDRLNNLYGTVKNPNSSYRIALALQKTLWQEAMSGHMFAYDFEIVKKIHDYINYYNQLDNNEIVEKEDIEDVLKTLSEDKLRGHKFFKFVREGSLRSRVYIRKLYDMEHMFGLEVASRFYEDSLYKHAADEIINTEAYSMYTEEQKRAVLNVFDHKISIITGGPGVGKTYTTKAIVDTINAVDPKAEIKGCAFTGRAAKKLKESSGIKESSTIHSLLDIQEFSSISDLKDVEADFVIIDEASMIELDIWYKLISKIDEDTNIVIIGDPNQLPAIGAGQILSDMITSCEIPTTHLTEVFRQEEGSIIIENSYKIIENNSILERGDDFHIIDRLNGLDLRNDVVIQNATLAAFKGLLKNNDIEDIQILAAIKDGKSGIKELNKEAQRIYIGPEYKGPSFNTNGYNIKEGDKVIHIRNNYDLERFNGEIGYVESITSDENGVIVLVSYDDGITTYDESCKEELELAYALTVHKSQGSQFKNVIFPLSYTHGMLLNKSILYTGITRAENKVYLIGEQEVIDRAINKDVNTRNSTLEENLIFVFNEDKKDDKQIRRYSKIIINRDKIKKDYNINDSRQLFSFILNDDRTTIYDDQLEFMYNIEKYLIIQDTEQSKWIEYKDLKHLHEIMKDSTVKQWFVKNDKVFVVYDCIKDFEPAVFNYYNNKEW